MHRPVRIALRYLGNHRGAADLGDLAIVEKRDPERGELPATFGLAVGDHLLVALLEDVERYRLSRVDDDGEWKERDQHRQGTASGAMAALSVNRAAV